MGSAIDTPFEYQQTDKTDKPYHQFDHGVEP